MTKVNLKLITFLVGILISVGFFVPMSQYPGFKDEFIRTDAAQYFRYGSGGNQAAFTRQYGVKSSIEPETSVLLLQMDPADIASPWQGPNMSSYINYYYGTYAGRVKIPEVDQQPNVGGVVGFFTYNDPSHINGHSEIDFEWLIADPEVLYMSVWSDWDAPAGTDRRRIGRTVNLAEGRIYNTTFAQRVNGRTQRTNLTGTENMPSTIPAIEGFNAAKQFHIYGFDWDPDRVRFWIIHPENNDTIVLWDYQGPRNRITQTPARFMMNFWHTNDWPVVTNSNSTERPKFHFGAEFDWVSYTPNLPDLYSLTLNAPNGSVTNSPRRAINRFPEGHNLTLTAVPDNGYKFANWSGDAEGEQNPIDIVFYSDLNITANFNPILSLSVNAENGSVTIDPDKEEYLEGEAIIITALPDEGFVFTGWTGDAEGSLNPLEINAGSNMDITANFAAIYSLSVTAENGSVTIDPEKDVYIENDLVTLTAVPDDGFIFRDWSGDADGNDTILVINMNENKNIIANFDIDTGISEINKVSNKIDIYPNPLTYGNLVIRTSVLSDISVFSLAGKLEMKFNQVNELLIHHSEFKPGVYVINIVSDNEVSSKLLYIF